MKTISFDQATEVTGFAVFESGKLVEHGVITVKGKNAILRMQEMQGKIKCLLEAHNPEVASIEGVQYQQNQKVYSTLSQMQGVVFSLFFDENIKFFIIEPTSWKTFSKINTKAKRIIQKMEAIQIIKNIYEVDVTEDEAEAILQGVYLNSFLEKEKECQK